jgi:hypothetical protein
VPGVAGLAALMGFTRVDLGVHWPDEVAAGAALVARLDRRSGFADVQPMCATSVTPGV